MSAGEYLRDKIVYILVNLILFLVLSAILILAGLDIYVICIVFCIWFFPLIVYMTLELVKLKTFYDEVLNTCNSLDKKLYLTEIIKAPTFIEGKVVYEIMKDLTRDMNEQVKLLRDREMEYREYIETWVHEIKTPIASSLLIIDNNETAVTGKIKLQINRIEDYVEQFLYYTKSNDVNKDYIITEFPLNTVIVNTIKKNARDFIYRKIQLDFNDTDQVVYSDIKWVEFILNQIIGNSVKYSKGDWSKISISAEKLNNSVILSIEDNGIGIQERDINRVFDKGFTGENGRVFVKSTGIGLYLCKNLCDKLGLGLDIKSNVGLGTEVRIIFPVRRLLEDKLK